MAVRGLLGQDLCRLAGIAEPTLSGLLRGRPVTASTIGRIARALAENPPIPLSGIEDLVRVAPPPPRPAAGNESAAGGPQAPAARTAGGEAADDACPPA